MPDSLAITVYESDDTIANHPNSYNGWSEDYAQIVVLKAVMQAQEAGDLQLDQEMEFQSYFCKEIETGNSNSEVCYLETNIGFFFAMRDMLDSITVVYNRWD